MRVVQNKQMQIGEVDISKIQFDLKSRDDIPRILMGLQHLYMNPSIWAAISKLLEDRLSPPDVDKNNGRPGMNLWSIFVCGVLRLDLGIDYDRLHELANKHIDLRLMLGNGPFNDTHYHHQTLKDNVGLLTPELLEELNKVIVDGGHILRNGARDVT